MYKIDLNCDMGESFGSYVQGNDEEMMKYITSANIACGYHAGDPHVMRQTVELAKKYDVAIGAHPGYPDLMGFGRREINCTSEEIQDYILYQMGALREFARAYDMRINHCKPHGALYMRAMEDENVARAILEALHKIDSEMIVFAVNNSAMLHEAIRMGVPVAKEGYSDREHREDGNLILTRKSTTITDYEAMANRVVRMVKDKKVITFDEKDADIDVQTICIHGDTSGAPELAQAIVKALKKADVEIVNTKSILA